MKQRKLIYDLETSAFYPISMSSDTNRVIQISAVCVETGDEFAAFVNPGIKIPPESSAIHRITNSDVKDAEPFQSVVERMFQFFGGLDKFQFEMIAHNNNYFDEVMFRREYQGSLPSNITFWDTLPFLRKQFPGLRSYSLGRLHEHFYSEELTDAHRADTDARALRRIYRDFVKEKR